MHNRINNILSIQSHVVYGYVGNKVANFVLQRLGNETLIINTAQLSTHTGYKNYSGMIFDHHHINQIIDTLDHNSMLSKCNAVISGYIGNENIGDSLLTALSMIKGKNNQAIYCCDPVMGDNNRGFFVQPEVKDFMQRAIGVADIITPNQFEACALTNSTIMNIDDLKSVLQTLHKLGPKIILITSVVCEGINNGDISNIIFDGQNYYLCTTPYIEFKQYPNGCGDLLASLFLSHYLSFKDIERALQLTVSSVFAILQSTKYKGSRELDIINSQDQLIKPCNKFPIIKLN